MLNPRFRSTCTTSVTWQFQWLGSNLNTPTVADAPALAWIFADGSWPGRGKWWFNQENKHLICFCWWITTATYSILSLWWFDFIDKHFWRPNLLKHTQYGTEIEDDNGTYPAKHMIWWRDMKIKFCCVLDGLHPQNSKSLAWRMLYWIFSSFMDYLTYLYKSARRWRGVVV